jgi:hypothetical protein
MHLGAFDQLTMLIILMMFGVIAQFLMLQYGKATPD